MKNFTCLLLIAMAVTYTMSAACTVQTDATSSFLARIKAINTAAVVGTGQAGTTTVCGTTFDLCCDVTAMTTIVGNQITKIKTTFTTFGGKIAAIGGAYAKIGALVNASTIGTTTPAATLGAAATADLSGATTAQFQAFGNYTPTAFVADYTAFAAALPDCFTKYSELIQKVACDGCSNAPTAVPTRYVIATASTNSLWLKQASVNAIAEKCAKVWNFMWKTGWFIQTVAYLNSKKATGYTYTAPAVTALYYQSTLTGTNAVTIDTINTAFTNCAADPTATTCTGVNKAVLVQAFVEIYGLDASLGVGRANTAIIATTYTSNARRMLAAFDGSVMLAATDADGFDTTAATAMWAPTTAVTLTAATDMATWSAGYVAPSTTTTSSSSSTTTKNAKVVIGTILSAIFAIAFLN